MRLALLATAIVAALTVASGSAQATDVPAAPSGLTWTPAGITWQDNSDNEDGFRLEKLIFAEWLFVTQYPVNATSGQVPSLGYDVGCVIPLRLIAFNSAGGSEPSEPIVYNPTPTPPTAGCPFTDTLTFTNETNQAANTFTLTSPYGYNTLALTQNAPGCGEPTITLSSQPFRWVVYWHAICVEPGEGVQLFGTGTGPAFYAGHSWTVTELSPTPTAIPTPSATAAAPPVTPTISPASLPTAGDSPGHTSNAALALAAGTVLLLVASLAFKRIR